ncbi:MAG TPA: carboxypeptidase-like regulatory domain-containing protein [Candidatus Limnocylindrales bacterium]|nr:carboxypeptidase-like regulatory domain-containing protein [Candidatus Limnocylindrales bacterium]
MRRRIACIASVFAVSLLWSAGAQARAYSGRIGGTILGTNGRPAAGVNVMVEGSDGSLPLATHTDSHGRFLFKFVPQGLYDIRASSSTAASAWKHNLLVHSARTTVVNLRLVRIKPRKKSTHAAKN